MSAPAHPQGPAPIGQPDWQAGERCPLCGAGVAPSQDWCLACGAAARTRLAATPRWWMPVLALVAVVLVSAGVLITALVKLAG